MNTTKNTTITVFALGEIRFQSYASETAPVPAALMGFKRRDIGMPSIVPSENPQDYVMGHLLELTEDQVERLDRFAEQTDLPFHRIEVTTETLLSGYKVRAWVYQAVCHATQEEPSEVLETVSA